MVKYLSILFIFIYSVSHSQVKVSAPLVRNSSLDTAYGTNFDTLGYGGHMTYETVANRNALFYGPQRKIGTFVYVHATDTVYALSGGTSNNNWLPLFKLSNGLSGNFVPYTGATNNVNLGNHYIYASDGTFQSVLQTSGILSSNISTGDAVNMFPTSLRFTNGSNSAIGTIDGKTNITVSRTWLFPDKAGTVELIPTTNSSDTTTYKPEGIDASGNTVKFNYWPGSGGSTVDTTSLIRQNKTVYNKSYFNSTIFAADFTASGFTPTITNVNSIRFASGVNDFNEFVAFNSGANNDWLNDYEITFKIKGAINASAHGIGIGKISINTWFQAGINAKIDFTANVLNIYNNAGTLLQSTNIGFTIAQNDVCKLQYSQQMNVLTMTFFDITQNRRATLQLTSNLATTQVNNMPNSAQFRIYNYGGDSTDISNVKITTRQVVNPHILFVGDSKTVGFSTGDQDLSFPVLSKRFGTVGVAAGNGDRTVELILDTAYITNYIKPRGYVIMCIGRNDLASGVSTATWQANYIAFANKVKSLGCTVIHILPIPETAVPDQSALYNFITTNSNFSSDTKIDPSIGWTNSLYLSSDGVHPNLDGAVFIANKLDSCNCIVKSTNYYPEALIASQEATLKVNGGTLNGQLNIAPLSNLEPLTISNPSAPTNYALIHYYNDDRSYGWTAGIGNHSESGLGVANSYLIFDATASAARFVIKNVTGNVGIGKTNPSTTLDVNGTAKAVNMTVQNPTNGNTYGLINYINSGNTQTYVTGIGNSSETIYGVANKFFILDLTANLPRMVMDQAGRFGFGTTTPSQKVTINGSINVSDSAFYTKMIAASSSDSLEYRDPITGLKKIGSIARVFPTLDTRYFTPGGNSFGTTAVIGATDANDLVLRAGGSNAVTLKTNGNFRIGTSLYVGSQSATSTALLNIAAGNSSLGPLQLSAGTVLTSPLDGMIEYSGTHFNATIGSTRYQLEQLSGSYSQSVTAVNTVTVSIGSTLPNTTYKVNITPTSTLSSVLFNVNNKTTTTFDVTFLGTPITGTISFDWSLFP